MVNILINFLFLEKNSLTYKMQEDKNVKYYNILIIT